MDLKRWFRVKYGYSTGEFVSVPEEYLAKAIYSKQKQSLFSYSDRIIDGKEIKNITPDYHKHTGWNSWYEPKDSEDFKQIERDCPSYDGYIDNATNLAIETIRTGNIKLLSVPFTKINLIK